MSEILDKFSERIIQANKEKKILDLSVVIQKNFLVMTFSEKN